MYIFFDLERFKFIVIYHLNKKHIEIFLLKNGFEIEV